MTLSNSFAKCRVHLFKQANKAMWSFLKEVNTQNGGKASIIIKLFNSLVVLVLLYNSEIWGSFLKVKRLHNFTKFKDTLSDESHKHEQLLNRLCKKSSNIAAKGELGIYHLNIEISVRLIKFFFHLTNIIKGGNKLIYSAVMECYNLWERGDNLSKELSWLSSVFYLFQIAGCRYSSISRYVELDEGLVIESLRTELQKLYRQHCFKTISLSGKLAPIYSNVKNESIEKSFIFLQSSIISIDQQLLNLEFLLITYQSKRVGGKVSKKLNANVTNASLMILGMKNTKSYTVMHLI